MSSTVPPAARPLPSAPAPAPAEKQENLLINLLCNVAAPALILAKLSSEDRLGPVWSLVVALSLPLGYGTWDLVTRRKWNFFSILGVVSVLLTGGLGLMKVDGFWFAVKEAAIPAIFGVAVIGSLRTRTPLVRTFLYNDKVLDTGKVQAVLVERGHVRTFEKLLVRATVLLAAAFFVSAVLNFVLARILLRSPSGTPEFNAELGKMTALSWPVIVLPSMAMTIGALWYLLAGIRRLTGLTLEEIFRAPPE
jgi:intracellular septation protein A